MTGPLFGAQALGAPGHVAGRASVELDGLHGKHERVAKPGKVEVIGWPAGGAVWTGTAALDGEGLFVMSVPDTTWHYRVGTVLLDGTPPVPVPLQRPDQAEGVAGGINYMFAAHGRADTKVVGLGDTAVLLKDGGKLGVRRRMGDRENILDATRDRPFSTSAGDFGYPGLAWLAGGAKPALQAAARLSLGDTEAYDRAAAVAKKGAEQAKKGDPGAARTFEQAIGIHPGVAAAHRGLAQIHSKARDRESERAALRRGIEHCPEDKVLRLAAGRTEMALRNPAGAEPHFRWLLERKPDDMAAAQGLADSLGAQGKDDAAFAVLKDACAPAEDAKCAAKMGDFQRRKGQLEAAVQTYRAGLRADAKSGRLQAGLVSALIALDRFEEADAAIRKPVDAFAAYWGAQAYRKAGRSDRVEPLLRAALAAHGDGSVSKTRAELEEALAAHARSLPRQCRWMLYLNRVQSSGQYPNWEDPPYTRHKQETGQALDLRCLQPAQP